MADSRTKNTVRNIVAGLGNRAVTIILPFVNRTALLWTLGAEFTGLATLFASILQVLGIAELGFGVGIVYSLYKPMAERDEETICRLLALFKRIYAIVGTVVFSSGLMVMPFLKLIIKGGYPSSINLYAIYFLYLLNSGLSYFLFAYKEALLNADQRQDVLNNIRSAVSVTRYLVQLAILLLTRNFYLYMIAAVLGTACTNLMVQRETVRRYPFVHEVKGKISFPIELKTQMRGLIVDRICDTCRNSFDSVIVSSSVGLIATTIYGNYYYIYNCLYGVMLTIVNAMTASIGNSIVLESQHKNYGDLEKFSFLFAWLSGWCTVCLMCLYQPFMLLWAGESLLLPNTGMILFCVYFYLINMNCVRNQYVTGTGMWWELRTSYIVEAAANLCLNIILGRAFGVNGVLLATILTIFFFNFLWRTRKLFHHYFKDFSLIGYLGQHLYYSIVTAVVAAICFRVCCLLPGNGLLHIILRGMVCCLVPNVLFLIAYLCIPQRKQAQAFIMGKVKNKLG